MVYLFVSALDVKHFQAVDKTVDPLHEIVQKDDVTEAKAKEPELGGEGRQVREVVKLVGLREVEQQVGEIGTPLGQLLKDLGGDQLGGQL